VPTNIGRGIFLERGGIQLVNSANLARVLPLLTAPALPFIAAYAIRVDSLARVEALLRSGGVAAERSGRTLVVTFPAELGQGAWLFAERAGDLPWRSGS
jgi:hypothetical protein